MKSLKYFCIIACMFSLVGCELLGIETTTIKGNWRSEKFKDGYYWMLQIDDDKYNHYIMTTDSTCSKRISGTWAYKNDTIELYSHDKKSTNLIVKQLSMNTMTLEHEKGFFIMRRMYNDPNDDYDGKFMEVFALKKGVWYYVYVVITITVGLLMIIAIFNVLYCLFNWIKDRI